MNLLWGTIAGVGAGLVATSVAPSDPNAFYSAAVQVIPVFLVAVALERSLVEILGTESSVAAEQIARVEREWTPPSSQTRTYYGVGLQLRELGPQTFTWAEIASHRSETHAMSDVDVARTLPTADRLSPADLHRVALALASRVVGSRSPLRRRTRAVSRDELLEQWDTLSRALTERAMERAKDQVRIEVGEAYRARRHRQRLSIVVSVSALAVAETLAFVGLLSPGRPYPLLFGATAAALAASFVAVTVDAVNNVLARELDVQSAGLDWSDEPVGSHWDHL